MRKDEKDRLQAILNIQTAIKARHEATVEAARDYYADGQRTRRSKLHAYDAEVKPRKCDEDGPRPGSYKATSCGIRETIVPTFGVLSEIGDEYPEEILSQPPPAIAGRIRRARLAAKKNDEQ